MGDIPDWIKENKTQVAVGIAGVVMMGVGWWQGYVERIQEDSEVVVYTASPAPSGEMMQVVIDVSGAVVSPGIYTLSLGARLNDALVAAGGLSHEADRGFVSRYMNLAEKVVDGMKVYIPTKDDPILAKNQAEQMTSETETSNQTIHINTATHSQLESLWGVGEARAQQIIDNRPYTSIEELTTKAKIPASILEKNSGKISL